MKNTVQFILAAAFLLFSVGTAFAQLQTPAASPNAKATYDVGLSEVHIDYNRPGVKDRTIFGGLVPYGEGWRTGANASTKVTFSDDVQIMGHDLEAGTYSLFSVPGEDEWQIMFHSNLSHNTPGGRDAEEDALVVNVDAHHHSDYFVETLTISVNDIRNSSASIVISWENTTVSIPFTVDTDSKVMTSIDQVMSGPSGRDYYVAASYFLEEGKDLKKAHKWVKKSVEMDGPRFWVLRTQGLIEKELGMNDEAIKSLEKSSEMAREYGNEGYPRMNAETIAEIRGN